MTADVHIVCRSLNQPTHVLTRLYQGLADGTGWSISSTARANADLNLYSLYIDVRQTKGLTAAYFSHYDEGNVQKRARWWDAAGQVDLCLVTAPSTLGLLVNAPIAPNCLTRFITPFVDPQFVPGEHRPFSEPPWTLGVAGFSYGDGRKGEDLIAQLLDRFRHQPVPPTAEVKWLFSGAGWPAPTHTYAWHEMHRFYQQLDLLVVPSRVEGIHMPTLEALACGVPVVVPRNVGITDLLPGHPAIWTYRAGDAVGLEFAVRQALDHLAATCPPPAAVRAIVDGTYTLAAWVESHQTAVNALLANQIKVNTPRKKGTIRRIPDSTPPVPNSLAVTVAYGPDARREAKTCIESVHTHMPGLPVALLSDQPGLGEDIFWELADGGPGARVAKLTVAEYPPSEYRHILYLDADTELVGPVWTYLHLLTQRWDMVRTIDPMGPVAAFAHKYSPEEQAASTDVLPFLQLQCGVMAWINIDAVRAYFRDWFEEWQTYSGTHDSMSSMRALHDHTLAVALLGFEWNTMLGTDYDDRTAGLLHKPTSIRRDTV